MLPMGLFSRKPRIEASTSNDDTTAIATSLIATSTYFADRARAMRVPTVSRARDLLCSLAASLPLEHIVWSWQTGNYVETKVAPDTWMTQPDPESTRAHIMAWTVDDLMFHGYAVWRVTSRRMLDNRPATFQWLPAQDVAISAQYWAGGIPYGDYTVTFAGQVLNRADLVLFWSPIQALLNTGARSILVAERLEQASLRFASTPTAFGYLKQLDGEPMTSDELKELSDAWAEARDTNSVAALNQFVDWKESQMDPGKLQLVESRQHAALEIARLANVPAYLVSAPTGSGMTYQNAQQSRQDLILMGALPYLEVIQQTLSTDAITPRGHLVRFDTQAWMDKLPGATQPTPPGAP